MHAYLYTRARLPECSTSVWRRKGEEEEEDEAELSAFFFLSLRSFSAFVTINWPWKCSADKSIRLYRVCQLLPSMLKISTSTKNSSSSLSKGIVITFKLSFWTWPLFLLLSSSIQFQIENKYEHVVSHSYRLCIDRHPAGAHKEHAMRIGDPCSYSSGSSSVVKAKKTCGEDSFDDSPTWRIYYYMKWWPMMLLQCSSISLSLSRRFQSRLREPLRLLPRIICMVPFGMFRFK